MYSFVSIGPYKYSNIADKLISCIYKAELLFLFDWTEWKKEAEWICGDPELIRKADLMTVRKLLTLHVRKERFCEGHFASMCENGVILLILKRVKVLFVDTSHDNNPDNYRYYSIAGVKL